ncbi:MAG TPA: hypothetical protein VGJ30_04665 [Candidatus Angelobacter sp.]|jgi:hypothetical protein
MAAWSRIKVSKVWWFSAPALPTLYFAECPASQRAFAALNCPTFLSFQSTDISPQNKDNSNKKWGFETGREYRYLIPRK